MSLKDRIEQATRMQSEQPGLGDVVDLLKAQAQEIDALRKELGKGNKPPRPEGASISVEDATDLLGCKRSRVFQLLADGTLERAPRYGREIRIFKASVVRALTPKSAKARKRNIPSPVGFELEDIPL